MAATLGLIEGGILFAAVCVTIFGWAHPIVVDWTDGGRRYIGPMFLYFFYGFYDAVWQTCIYW